MQKETHTENILLEGQHVSIGYRQKKQDVCIHADLNFRLHQGELTCLLGANGSGKSTLLRTLSAVQPSLSGDIRLLDKSLNDYTERERSRTIGVVLTERTQTGGLTVSELVALGRQPHTGFFGRLNATDQKRIADAIESVGITRLARSYMAELSDGERQKAFIAKALVQECPLILLDEPTAFLDVVSRIEIMNLLRRLAREEQKAILLSTHDIDQALLLADRLWLLRAHQDLTCGVTEELTCGVTEDLILAHQLDDLFPTTNICFDAQNGTYMPRPEYNKTILLEAADARLRHWSENALHRLGYKCISEETTTRPSTLRLTVASPHQLTLHTSTEETVFTTYEALLRELMKQS